MDLKALLPVLTPRAVEWARSVSDQVASTGLVLNDAGLSLARSVGVEHPDRIRLAMVIALPVDDDPLLQQAAAYTGVLGPNSVGITLGYSVIVRHGYQSPRLLSHEFRQVQQYEKGGSIESMVPVYLNQIVEFGYDNAPMEVDARAAQSVPAQRVGRSAEDAG